MGVITATGAGVNLETALTHYSRQDESSRNKEIREKDHSDLDTLWYI